MNDRRYQKVSRVQKKPNHFFSCSLHLIKQIDIKHLFLNWIFVSYYFQIVDTWFLEWSLNVFRKKTGPDETCSIYGTLKTSYLQTNCVKWMNGIMLIRRGDPLCSEERFKLVSQAPVPVSSDLCLDHCTLHTTPHHTTPHTPNHIISFK